MKIRKSIGLILLFAVALVTAFYATAFFGYGIAHGSGAAFLVFPFVLAIFVLPIWYTRSSQAKQGKTRRSLPRVVVWLFPGLIVAVVAYLSIVKPAIEYFWNHYAYSRAKFELISEEPVIVSNAGLIGVKLRYAFKVKTAIPRFMQSNSFLPVPILVPPGKEEYPESVLRSWNRETRFNGEAFNEIVSPGELGTYETSEEFLYESVSKSSTGYCRQKPGDEKYATERRSRAEKAGETRLEAHFHVELVLSNRMGHYPFEHSVIALRNAYAVGQMPANAERLPSCPVSE
jgi:hypothetical protein